jgi:hypothetical protein
MKTKLAPSIEPDVKPVRERRRNARVKLSCFILVRPLEPGPEFFESIMLADNSSRQGLSFKTDDILYCQRMRLLVTYPYSLHPSAINQDYIAEVVRRVALPGGRYRIALRFLTTAKLSIPYTSKLRSIGIWNPLWHRARANTNTTKLDCGALVNRPR